MDSKFSTSSDFSEVDRFFCEMLCLFSVINDKSKYCQYEEILIVFTLNLPMVIKFSIFHHNLK